MEYNAGMNDQTPMRPVLSIRLFTHAKCFGPGIAELLRRVRATRSLRAAAFSMDMAYSKAWRIVRESEDALGFKLLKSTTGGAHGGGAVLTPEAEKLLDNYTAFTKDVQAEAERLFGERFFSDGDGGVKNEQ